MHYHCTLRTDLPEELLARVLGHASLSARDHRALFSTCNALARLVLLHVAPAPCLAHRVSSSSTNAAAAAERWPAALVHLFRARWQPVPAAAALQLRLEPSPSADPQRIFAQPRPPSRLPPADLRRHVAWLTLYDLSLGASDLANLQLHSQHAWPALRRLTIDECAYAAPAGGRGGARKAPPASPDLRVLELAGGVGYRVPDELLDALLALAGEVEEVNFAGPAVCGAAGVARAMNACKRVHTVRSRRGEAVGSAGGEKVLGH